MHLEPAYGMHHAAGAEPALVLSRAEHQRELHRSDGVQLPDDLERGLEQYRDQHALSAPAWSADRAGAVRRMRRRGRRRTRTATESERSASAAAEHQRVV